MTIKHENECKKCKIIFLKKEDCVLHEETCKGILCDRCSRRGHYKKECEAEVSIDGYFLEPVSSDSD